MVPVPTFGEVVSSPAAPRPSKTPHQKKNKSDTPDLLRERARRNGRRGAAAPCFIFGSGFFPNGAVAPASRLFCRSGAATRHPYATGRSGGGSVSAIHSRPGEEAATFFRSVPSWDLRRSGKRARCLRAPRPTRRSGLQVSNANSVAARHAPNEGPATSSDGGGQKWRRSATPFVLAGWIANHRFIFSSRG